MLEITAVRGWGSLYRVYLWGWEVTFMWVCKNRSDESQAQHILLGMYDSSSS